MLQVISKVVACDWLAGTITDILIWDETTTVVALGMLPGFFDTLVPRNGREIHEQLRGDEWNANCQAIVILLVS